MSTPPQPIVSLIERAYSQYLRQRTNIAWLDGFGLALFVFGVFILLEHLAYLPIWVKSVSIALIPAVIILYIVYFKRIHPPQSFTGYYRRFCDAHGLAKLKYFLDLHRAPDQDKTALHSAAMVQLEASLQLEEIQHQLDRANTQYVASPIFAFRHWAGWTGLTLLSLVALLDASTIVRGLHFWHMYEKPLPFSYVLLPESDRHEQGKPFVAELILPKFRAKKVALGIKTTHEKQFRRYRMTTKTDSSFVSDPLEISDDVLFYVDVDGYQTPIRLVQMMRLPRIDQLIARITPPPYTGKQATTLSYPFAQLEAYKGAQVHLTASVNKEGVTAALQTKGTSSTEISAIDEGLQKHFSFTLTQSDTLYFDLVDTQALKNRNPYTIVLKMLDDAPPMVSILQPEPLHAIREPGVIELIYSATDDFGIRSVQLQIEKKTAFSEKIDRFTISLTQAQKKQYEAVRYEWDIRSYGLLAYDQLSYRIEVMDNDAVNGFKKAQSATHLIQITSLLDAMEELDEKEDALTRNMDEAIEQFRQTKEELERFKENITRDPLNQWQQARDMEQLQQDQKQLQDKVDEIRKAFEAFKQEMNEDQQLSTETIQKYDELQRLMEDLDNEELRKALEELQNSLKSLDQNAIKNALNEVQFNEQRYQERLERTIELFKNLQLQANLEQIANALDELKTAQEQVPNEQQSAAELTEEQKRLQQDLDRLMERLNELPEKSPKRRKEQVETLSKESQQDLKDIQQLIEEYKKALEKASKEQASSGNEQGEDGGEESDEDDEAGDEGEQTKNSPPNPNVQRKQISERLKNRAEKLRAAQGSMGGQQININILALKSALQTLLLISETQEELAQGSSGLANRSQAFVELARQQKNVQRSFGFVVDSLSQIAREVPQFSNQMIDKKLIVQQQIDVSLGQLAEREARASAGLRQTLGGVNELAVMVANLIDNLEAQQNSSGGGGGGMSMQQMLEQMKKMSGDQQQMNEQLQNMINSMQGDRLSNDQMERLNQFARQQNEIRKQLKELQEKGGLAPGDKALSELERLAEEMEQAINDLRGGAVDRIFIDRQQNILSRMLSAEKALEERGEDDKREGESAKQHIGRSPDELTLEELRQLLRSRLSDPNTSKYNEEYQKLIKRYFEFLEKLLEQES